MKVSCDAEADFLEVRLSDAAKLLRHEYLNSGAGAAVFPF
jgi:hypothetical protein